MFHKFLLHKIGIGLVVAGLLLTPAASVFAQANEPNDDPVSVVADEVEAGNDIDSASNRVFLPLIQADLATDVIAADINFDFCKTQAANATLTLGSGVSSVNSTSNVVYSGNLCNRWVVDIRVPSNSSGTGSDLLAFGIGANGTVGPPNKADCESYTEQTSIYRKAYRETEFKFIAGGTKKGVWHTESGTLFPCELRAQPGWLSLAQPLTPPGSSTDFYRVASNVKFGGQWRTVTIQAEHFSPPPK
jgi:hypothetical protein